MDDKTLSYHKRTELEPNNEMPASPKGIVSWRCYAGRWRTNSRLSGSVDLARNPFVIERFLAKFHPTASWAKAILPSKSA